MLSAAQCFQVQAAAIALATLSADLGDDEDGKVTLFTRLWDDLPTGSQDLFLRTVADFGHAAHTIGTSFLTTHGLRIARLQCGLT